MAHGFATCRWCMLESVSISDAQFRIGVVGAAVLLAAGITVVRFCGSVSLPPKPEAPNLSRATGTALADENNSLATVYADYLAKDAATAGVKAPSYEEMSKKLVHRGDEGRHVLEIGAPAVTLAGLELALQRSGDAIVLDIHNTTQATLAYLVVTEPIPNAGCTNVEPLPINALVIEPGQHEVRVECAWRPNIALAVKRVETIELAPLSAWYLMQVSPATLGIEPRIARAHRKPKGGERCISLVSQVVRAALESGEIGWRDLADFYARHRCQTYPFPASYRALRVDGERRLPAQ